MPCFKHRTIEMIREKKNVAGKGKRADREARYTQMNKICEPFII